MHQDLEQMLDIWVASRLCVNRGMRSRIRRMYCNTLHLLCGIDQNIWRMSPFYIYILIAGAIDVVKMITFLYIIALHCMAKWLQCPWPPGQPSSCLCTIILQKNIWYNVIIIKFFNMVTKSQFIRDYLELFLFSKINDDILLIVIINFLVSTYKITW